MFSDPIKNLSELSLKLGSTVADFGAGSGHYVLVAAKEVGEKGRVYAVDIQKELLSRIKNEATREGLSNVEALWGDIESPGGSRLKDSSVDFVILSNIMFQLEEKAAAAQEALRVLKPGGRLLLVDWSESFGSMGPIEDHVFTKDDALTLFNTAGFAPEKEFDAGAHHYGIIFKRP